MITRQSPEVVTLDPLDEQIVRALQVSPRAPFRRIAQVLDVSEQTVARRYRGMYRAGLLRVVAVIEPTAFGESNWIVRIRTRPGATLDLGRALAQRPDVAWISVSAGGSELICAVRSHTQQTRERLLIDRLPRTAAVLDVAASLVLRRFVGGSPTDWVRLQHVLNRRQEQRLSGDDIASRSGDRTIERLTADDYAMLDVLTRDGRAPIGAIAKAAGVSEGRAARRLATLFERGVVYLDLDLASAAIGYPTSAYLWLTVPPARLEATGQALAQHEQTAFVAAVTGRANAVASVTCRSIDDLYRYVTEDVGAIVGVQSLEISLVLRRLKQAGTLVDGDRLTEPPTGRH